MVSDIGIEASQRLIMDPYIVLNLKLPYAQSLYNLERKLWKKTTRNAGKE